MRNDLIVVELSQADGGDVVVDPRLVADFATGIGRAIKACAAVLLDDPSLEALHFPILLTSVEHGSLRLGYVAILEEVLGEKITRKEAVALTAQGLTITTTLGAILTYVGVQLGLFHSLGSGAPPARPLQPAVEACVRDPQVGKAVTDLVATAKGADVSNVTVSFPEAPAVLMTAPLMVGAAAAHPVRAPLRVQGRLDTIYRATTPTGQDTGIFLTQDGGRYFVIVPSHTRSTKLRTVLLQPVTPTRIANLDDSKLLYADAVIESVDQRRGPIVSDPPGAIGRPVERHDTGTQAPPEGDPIRE